MYQNDQVQKTPIQIHVKLSKNHHPPNIVLAKYNENRSDSFSMRPDLVWWCWFILPNNLPLFHFAFRPSNICHSKDHINVVDVYSVSDYVYSHGKVDRQTRLRKSDWVEHQLLRLFSILLTTQSRQVVQCAQDPESSIFPCLLHYVFFLLLLEIQVLVAIPL